MPVQANPAPLLQTPQKHRPAPPPPPCKISGKSRCSMNSTKMRQAFYDLFEKQSIRYRYIFPQLCNAKKTYCPFTSPYARIEEKRGEARSGRVHWQEKKHCSFTPANPAIGGNRAGIPSEAFPHDRNRFPRKRKTFKGRPQPRQSYFPKFYYFRALISDYLKSYGRKTTKRRTRGRRR